MSCSDHLEHLGDYVDGALSGAALAEIDAHLATCGTCRAFAEDLRRIRAAAASLDSSSPGADLWGRIAARLAAEPRAHARHTLPMRRSSVGWLAAAAALAIVVAGTIWAGWPEQPSGGTPASPRSGDAAASRPAGGASSAALAQSVEAELKIAEAHYDKAIATLEQIAAADDSTLDPQVAASLKGSLAVIDQAIAESRAALRTQPDSELARDSLFEGLRRKVALLQDIIALVNEMRKGHQTEAGQIADRLNRSRG